MTETVTRTVAIVRDQDDRVAMSTPARWATGQLADALTGRGIPVRQVSLADGNRDDLLRIVLAGVDTPMARGILHDARAQAPTQPEALALVSIPSGGVLAAGTDPRGLVYAALELADRVSLATTDPFAALDLDRPIVQHPANPIRGISRLFASDVEDLGWFRDRAFWQRYLSMLARYRFNRIQLAFGMGHDFLRNVVDAYLLFAYPFLIDVPGFPVQVPGFSDAERDVNLAALRVASDEAAARGLHFQLGIWTQAYEWTDSPDANFVIHGLTPDNHAAYCRAAIRGILQACPSIAGVTFRVHGESGVPEGNYDFWREVFRGVVECGRRVELDMHPKGVGQEMIQVGLDTGLPLTLSPKYTAEHMGLPGHQVAIREIERQPAGEEGPDAFRDNLMNQSGAGLRYTRYGNADFLREDRRYGTFYRIWPGTQRFLLWGDPALAAGFGRSGSFCGSLGVELCEPLSFKGRRGSGMAGGREGYADESLRLDDGSDWEKFDITYRLFGRLLYDPDEDRAVWRRALARDFGAAAAEPVETALSHASRVLPLVTSAYHPSAANNRYWPEIYTNLPIVDEERSHPYRDTRRPRRFGAASPLDPGLFSGVDEFVQEVSTGQRSGRVSPLRVADLLDSMSVTARRALAEAERVTSPATSPRFRRLAVDVTIQAGLASFFAAKLRAGVAFELYRQTGDSGRVGQAVESYESARQAWRGVIDAASVYRPDLTVGGEPWLRGHWSDRLAAIDDDLAAMRAEQRRVPAPSGPASPLADLDPPAPSATWEHQPPASFRPGEPIPLAVWVRVDAGREQPEIDLHYRRVNQAETYVVQRMRHVAAECFEATIPANHADLAYPLQYFFVLRLGQLAWRYPDLATDVANQPYYVLRHGRYSR